MTKKKKNLITSKWYDLAVSDFDMAIIAFKHNKLLHCAFNLQQTNEKILKGLFISIHNDQPPYIHDLAKLATLITNKKTELKVYNKLFTGLNPYYILARYPTYRESLSQSLTKDSLNSYISKTEELLKWAEQLLK